MVSVTLSSVNTTHPATSRGLTRQGGWPVHTQGCVHVDGIRSTVPPRWHHWLAAHALRRPRAARARSQVHRVRAVTTGVPASQHKPRMQPRHTCCIADGDACDCDGAPAGLETKPLACIRCCCCIACRRALLFMACLAIADSRTSSVLGSQYSSCAGAVNRAMSAICCRPAKPANIPAIPQNSTGHSPIS